ncbi:MAG: hypothetical protein OXF02_00390 [Simkaniaceae bacterium]|nr:hypothetical protein [Simkaniaceae bacterium]
MASAIGEKRSTAWPERAGTAIWNESYGITGGPPLRFEPLQKGKKRTFTKEEKEALVDYVLEMRETKSLAVCAEECGIARSNFSIWMKTECKTYPEMDGVDPDAYSARVTDHRALLADLRAGTGTRPVHLPDYFIGNKSSGKQNQGRRMIRAEEQTRKGHPYFVSVGSNERRMFTPEQKKKRWITGFMNLKGIRSRIVP